MKSLVRYLLVLAFIQPSATTQAFAQACKSVPTVDGESAVSAGMYGNYQRRAFAADFVHDFVGPLGFNLGTELVYYGRISRPALDFSVEFLYDLPLKDISICPFTGVIYETHKFFLTVPDSSRLPEEQDSSIVIKDFDVVFPLGITFGNTFYADSDVSFTPSAAVSYTFFVRTRVTDLAENEVFTAHDLRGYLALGVGVGSSWYYRITGSKLLNEDAVVRLGIEVGYRW